MPTASGFTICPIKGSTGELEWIKAVAGGGFAHLRKRKPLNGVRLLDDKATFFGPNTQTAEKDAFLGLLKFADRKLLRNKFMRVDGMRKRLAMLIALASLFVPISVVHASWWGDSTYEECMLSEMKGQDRSMYWIVEKVCSRRFKREVYVSAFEVNIQWYKNGNRGQIEILKSGEYEITQATVKLIGKHCDEIKPEEWREANDVDIMVVNNSGSVNLSAKQISNDDRTCLHTESFRGRYK